MVQLQSQSSSCLLQELVLALSGHTGDVFVHKSSTKSQNGAGEHKLLESWTKDVQIANDLTWVAPAERELMNEVAKLGFHCRELRKFCAWETRARMQNVGSPYCCAFAEGLSELLSVYQVALLQLQQHLLQEPEAPLAGLPFLLSEFQVLLPMLHQMTYKIQAQDLTGGSLLHLVAMQVQTGNPTLHSCLLRLQWHCHNALFKQLTAWMLHGLLIDPQQESFIQRQEPQQQPPGLSEAAGTSGPLSSPTPPVHISSQHDEAVGWHEGFQVRMAALPPLITLKTAESILFIGKAVRVLQRSKVHLPGPPLLTQADLAAFAEALQALQAAPALNRTHLEQTIEDIRTAVAGRLWQLISEQANLSTHLNALRDYFLLGRGDFLQAFLIESRSLMALPPRPSTAEEDDPVFAHLTPSILPPEEALPLSERNSNQGPNGKRRGLHVPAVDQWARLNLQLHIRWPLHLLLTPQVLERYQAMFRYLLLLKRTALTLDAAWSVLRRRTAASAARQPALVPLTHLRHQMAHFISNLLVYIQTD
ncbi:hypothetical protein WJX84_009043, partial [Apatococcus fuscideae]